MARKLAIVVGVMVLVGSGVVHGLWTDRWNPSDEVERAGERLADLPADVGSWKGEPVKQDAEDLQQAGALAHYSRAFTDPETGEQVMVLLLAGRAARMVVHQPEHCYRSAGFEMSGQPLSLKVTLRGGEEAELWTGLFSRDDPGGAQQLRIFWTWFSGERWEAPANPRLSFARRKVLYKLYVIRNVTGSTPLPDDPCVRLLGELLPILEQALSAA
jgi:hypothetical protein